MTREDRERTEARANKIARAAADDRSGKTGRDATTKAVLDNMARLKALRLAREAAEPARPAASPKRAPARSNKAGEKTPALSTWLASQQSGGRRT